ncbi:MAG: S41 family peptidase [Gammaproteobacteria bacterium]|nr:S41 family peptidase [Gammaproteobacteria bacterium]
MKTLTRGSALVLAGFLVAIIFVDGERVHAERSEPGTLPLEELRAFTESYSVIKRHYVEPVEDSELLGNAIQGMLTGLDPHSSYLDKEGFKSLREGTSGEFGGLGIEVGMEDGFIKVIAPIDDTPAHRAGVEAGDLVIRLDDTPVKGLSLTDAVKLMRGKPGTDITLTIAREGADGPIEITITRAIIQIRSVRSRTLEPGFGYIRISQFQVNTGAKLEEALRSLKAEQDGKLDGLVLDLRNNPGGVLSAAVDVSNAFLTSGLVVYTEGRDAQNRQEYSASGSDQLNGAPLVVLINGGSASASEIVAGALHDHQRAVLMGQQSFGKGSVQTILPMNNDTAIKLTTARYYTPSGTSIQAKGIAPDIELDRLRFQQQKMGPGLSIKEKDLSGHLENGDGEGEGTPAVEDGSGEKDPPLAETDYELYEALNLLKALKIVGQAKP